MKAQDLKKECLATVGLQVEFSNSEIGSLSSLLWEVTHAINFSIECARQTVIEQQRQFKDTEQIPATIDLNSLKRIEWLLVTLTRRDMSGLFADADTAYFKDLEQINNVSSKM